MKKTADKDNRQSTEADDRTVGKPTIAGTNEKTRATIENKNLGAIAKTRETTAPLSPERSDQAWVGWGFRLRWLAATTLGVGVGMAIFLAGVGAFPGVGAFLDIESDAAFGAALGAIFGTTLGTTQWLVLRKHVDVGGAWVPLTALSWSAFWALNIAGVLGEGEELAGKIVEGLAHGLLLGALVGAAQWIALRKSVTGAGWWIVINGLCWSASAATGDASRVLLGDLGGADLLIAFLLACGLMGLGMAWLLRRSLARA